MRLPAGARAVVWLIVVDGLRILKFDGKIEKRSTAREAPHRVTCSKTKSKCGDVTNVNHTPTVTVRMKSLRTGSNFVSLEIELGKR